mmetsp:Transcript_5986/g.10267  ORF Transcript_5986/g.10267 Transcript_5986/m.10267 type:complete len:414 (+) Transcript_5986:62-1303(+)
MGATYRQWRPCIVFFLLSFTLLTAAIAGVWSVVLFIHLDGLKTNMVGDPEKEFLDDCMRDFEHLAQDDPVYLTQRENCISDLESDEGLKYLPQIRLTVDERICDIADLCEDGDPGQCEDRGSPGTSDFQAGTVRQCYEQISAAKAERNETRRTLLLQQAQTDCIDASRWDNYEHQTQLAYCMWKQREYGVCTNSLSATLNCPEDTSCCPVAQNRLITPNARPDKYQCAKSPLVGLYCQHVNYTVLDVPEQPCTSVTCSTFDWCRDFIDVSDQCITEPCEQYRRARNYAIPCIVFAGIAILLDFTDIVILCCYNRAAGMKAAVDVTSACVKLIAVLLCVIGGIQDFTNGLVNRGCYVPDGTNLAETTRRDMRSFMTSSIFSMLGSLCLSPLSASWGGKLVDLPFVGRGSGVATL